MTNELYPWAGPMPTILQEGSPLTIGRVMGRGYRRSLAIMTRYIWKSLLEGPLGLSRQTILTEVERLRHIVADVCGDAYLTELQGMAEGSGLTEEDMLVANCGFDLALVHTPSEMRAQMFARFERMTPGCSSFVAWGQATVDGRLICAHNSDGPRFPWQYQVCRLVRPDTGLAFISPTAVGRVGQHSMMNSAGLFIAGLALDAGTAGPGNLEGVPLPFVFRCLIQTCASTPEAVETLAQLPLMNAGSYLFADRERRVELVQATPQRQVSVRPAAGGDTFHVTNHAIVEEIKPYLTLRPYPSSTHYRYQSLGKRLEEAYGSIDETHARQIMSNHYDEATGSINPGENSLCRHHEYYGELGGTGRSSVWNLGEGIAHIALGNPCRGYWTEIVGFFGET